MTAVKGLKARLRTWPVVAGVNAAIKARAMELDVIRTRRRYEEEARRRNLTIASGASVQEALRRRLGDRPDRLGWPKQPGELHLFLVYGLHNWEAILPKTLASFGRVSSFEWRSHGFDERAPDWLVRRDEMNRALLAAYRAASAVAPVDVVVAYVSGATVAPEVLTAMATDGAVVTNFCFDDKVYWPGPRLGDRHTSPAAIAHAVDLNLTSDPNGLIRYAAHGGIAMFHPEAADPELHRPLDLDFEYDVSFIGARYGWRPAFIKELHKHGVHVRCFGKGWPDDSISNDEMRSIYARSRINLGFGGIGHSRNLVCLKGRDFEVPMSGALYLTQHNPELALVFDIGREIVTYRDETECAGLILDLLADPQRAAAIRSAARARCLRDHTYSIRWLRVMHTLGALSKAEETER